MAILKAVLKKLPAVINDDSNLLAQIKGFSGAVLTEICQRAFKLATRESKQKNQRRTGQTVMDNDEPVPVLEIRCNHFEEAIDFARRLSNQTDISQ
jgi:transitional endoplasmic reticulum ATPase